MKPSRQDPHPQAPLRPTARKAAALAIVLATLTLAIGCKKSGKDAAMAAKKPPVVHARKGGDGAKPGEPGAAAAGDKRATGAPEAPTPATAAAAAAKAAPAAGAAPAVAAAAQAPAVAPSAVAPSAVAPPAVAPPPVVPVPVVPVPLGRAKTAEPTVKEVGGKTAEPPKPAAPEAAKAAAVKGDAAKPDAARPEPVRPEPLRVEPPKVDAARPPRAEEPPAPPGTVVVHATPAEPPLDVNGYIFVDDLAKVVGTRQKFHRAELTGVTPSPNYNALFFAAEKFDLFGFAVQVWRDPNLAESRTRFNTMKNSYSNVTPTNKVTDMGFRAFYGAVVTLVFVDPRRPLVAAVSCSTKLCSGDQMIELARRVAERLH